MLKIVFLKYATTCVYDRSNINQIHSASFAKNVYARSSKGTSQCTLISSSVHFTEEAKIAIVSGVLYEYTTLLGWRDNKEKITCRQTMKKGSWRNKLPKFDMQLLAEHVKSYYNSSHTKKTEKKQQCSILLHYFVIVSYYICMY